MTAALPALFETYDSVLDMRKLSATYGVRPTSLGDFTRALVAAARERVG